MGGKVNTKGRTLKLSAASEELRESWMSEIRSVFTYSTIGQAMPASAEKYDGVGHETYDSVDQDEMYDSVDKGPDQIEYRKPEDMSSA